MQLRPLLDSECPRAGIPLKALQIRKSHGRADGETHSSWPELWDQACSHTGVSGKHLVVSLTGGSHPETLNVPMDPGIFQGWRPFPIKGELGDTPSSPHTHTTGRGAVTWLLLLWGFKVTPEDPLKVGFPGIHGEQGPVLSGDPDCEQIRSSLPRTTTGSCGFPLLPSICCPHPLCLPPAPKAMLALLGGLKGHPEEWEQPS